MSLVSKILMAIIIVSALGLIVKNPKGASSGMLSAGDVLVGETGALQGNSVSSKAFTVKS
jgi:hypothetical protein